MKRVYAVSVYWGGRNNRQTYQVIANDVSEACDKALKAAARDLLDKPFEIAALVNHGRAI